MAVAVVLEERLYCGEELRMNEPHLVDETRVRAVCDYLRETFRVERLVPFVERGVQGFRVEDIFGTLRHVLSVSGDFFRAHTSQEIPSALREFQVARALRQAGRTTVEVTTSGVRMLDPKPGEGERMAEPPGKHQ
jgi:hypothetical protein